MNRIMYRATEDITVEELAEQYGTTPINITRLNDIHGIIKKGMRVLIDIQEGQYYIVQPFDDISRIAKKFGIKEQVVKEYNGIENVFIGQRIFVPKAD